MKPISNNFKNALKSIKQIDAIISFADRENTNYIITQRKDFLLTEAQDYLVTESAEVRIDNGGIQNCSIYWNTDIFKSVCKMIDLETSTAIPKGTEINIKVGLLIGEDYEYIDYGKFYINEEPSYNLDTGTYTTTGYDKMIFFNIKAIENPLTFESDVTYTLKQYLNMICDKCGVAHEFDFSNVINGDEQIISGDPYATNKDVTYRDIIDDIAESLGTNFIINANNKITNKELVLSSNMTIDADNIRDTKVYIGEKKDPIDGLQIYDGSAILNYTGEDGSIFKIKSNNIMSANSSELMNGVLSMIRDFYYYAYQLETFGILALEPFDCFTLSYNNTNYLLCSFHNDIKISSGLNEEISYEFKEEDNVNEYMTSSDEDKSRDASIMIDKANGQIVLKANSNGKIVKAELDANADEGSAFNVEADNINFTGKTFNLTADNMAITSTNFSVDKNGNMSCNKADVSNINIRSGKIELQGGTSSQPNFIIKEGSYYNRLLGERLDILGGGGKCGIQTNGDPGIDFESSHAGTYPYSMCGMGCSQNGDDSNFYIGTYINASSNYGIFGDASPSYTALVISNGTNATVITPTTVTPGSLQESKKDFEKVKNALEIIKNTDIYKYHYKSENNKDKKHYGFVIGKDYNYSKEITSVDNEGKEIGADLYSFVSICCQAIKEQQEQIEQLKKDIKELKNEK